MKKQDEKNQALYHRVQEQPGKNPTLSPGMGGTGGVVNNYVCRGEFQGHSMCSCVCTRVLVHVYLGAKARGSCWISKSSDFGDWISQ